MTDGIFSRSGSRSQYICAIYIYIYINTYIHIHLQAAAEASMGRIVMRLSPSGHGHLEIGASQGHMKAGYLTLLTHANMFHARLTLTGYQGA